MAHRWQEKGVSEIHIAWVDDEIGDYYDAIGFLSLSGIICYACKNLTELFACLERNSHIQLIIFDRKLAGGEDGEAMLQVYRESRPDIGILVYSNAIQPQPANKHCSIERLNKSSQDFSNEYEDLISSVHNAIKYRPKNVANWKNFSWWRKVLKFTWDFIFLLLSYSTIRAMPIFYLVVAIVLIWPNIDQSLSTNGNPSGATDQELAIKSLLTILPMLFGYALCWGAYWLLCPRFIRNFRRRLDFETNWVRSYLANKEVASSVHEQLGPRVFKSGNRDQEAAVNVNILYNLERERRTFARFIILVIALATLVFFVDAFLKGWGLPGLPYNG